MLWLVFSLFNAFFESLKDVFSKKSLRVIDEYSMAWALRFYGLFFVVPALIYAKIPPIGPRFFEALIVSGLINTIAAVLYIKAIEMSDLSLVSPMLTSSPLFLLVTSPLIVNEFPPLMGVIGILFIVIGAYVLNFQKKSEGYFEPFKALVKEKGTRLMLIVAFIWSISANFDKIGVQNSSSIFWVFALNVFVVLSLFPIMMWKGNGIKSILSKNAMQIVPASMFWALSPIFQMIAIKMTLVAYTIVVKRTSTLISVFFGHLYFKEKGLKERLLGAILMVIGVFFIALS